MRISSIIQLCRPIQWIKNLFVWLPAFFSGNLLNLDININLLVVFSAFCMISSAIYCLNDYIDAKFDKLHPVKRFRPVASGEIGRIKCMVIIATLLICGAGIIMVLPNTALMPVMCITATYLIINIAYCFWLKAVAIIDVTIIALGYVLRVAAGGVATGIYVSHWLIIVTFLLALFLALSKRREDVLLYIRTGLKVRSNISRYSIGFINRATTLLATIIMVIYILYTVSPDVTARFGSDYVYLTSIFVLAGLLRYMQRPTAYGGNPIDILLHDHFIQLTLIGWSLTFGIIIYL